MRLGDLDLLLKEMNNEKTKYICPIDINQRASKKDLINITLKAYRGLIFEIIKDLPTVEVPQWIPCSERLPTNKTEWWCTTEYLTCSKDGTIQVLCYCDGWNCSFLNADMDVYRDSEIKDIIAWMPLPQLYTENRKES